MRKRLNRLFFWLTALFYFWSFYVQNPISVSYSMEFGLSGAALGAVSGMSNVIAVLTMPLVASMAERRPVRHMIVAGYALQLASFFVTWRAGGVAMIVLGKALCGLSFAITIVLMASIAVSIYPPELSGRIISLYTMVQAFIQAAATSCGLFISARWGYRLTYQFAVIGSLACLVFCAMMSDFGAAKPAHAGAKPQICGKLPKNVVPVLLLCLFCGITVNAVQSFTEPFAKRSGQTAGLELFFAVYAGALVLVRFALAGGLTRMKLRSAVLLLSPVTVLAMLLMQYQQSAAALLAAAVAAAMGIGCMQTMSQCLVFERFGPDGKNQASSLFYMFFYGGMIAGSFGGSAIFTSSAGGSLFLLYAALSVLPFAAALLRPGRG